MAEMNQGPGTLGETKERFGQTIRSALTSIPVPELREPLYHFTDCQGLDGILRTRSLWATLATALDDTSEIAFALARAKRLVESGGARDDAFLADVAPLLDLRASETIDALGMKWYVVSFRTGSDARAHWATYGRNGTGCALAFALKPLVIPGTLARPVIYDEGEQDRLLRDFVESNVRAFDDISARCPTDQDLRALRYRAIHLTALGLWILSPFIKDPSFKDEQEWRIVVTDLEHMSTSRTRKGSPGTFQCA